MAVVPRHLSACFVGVILGVLASACGAAHTPTDLPASPNRDTALGVGDVFEVRVYGEDELSARYAVAQDGTIDFPFIGRIEVMDLKPPEVADLLETRLEEEGYLRSPHISVLVEEYKSKQISVVGAVQSPGSYSMTPGMTMMRAISQAGGFTALANRNSTTVTRQVEGERVRLLVPAGDIQEGEAQDFRLRPGDIVYVPERVF